MKASMHIRRTCMGLAALLCTSCATTAPEPRIVVQYVEVPVPIKCAPDIGPAPDYPDTDGAIAAAPDIFVLSQLYRAGRGLRITREAVLEAALKGCSGP